MHCPLASASMSCVMSYDANFICDHIMCKWEQVKPGTGNGETRNEKWKMCREQSKIHVANTQYVSLGDLSVEL